MRVNRARRSRSILIGAIVVFAMAVAPGAFARGHVGISIGFSGPGYSVGYSDFGHGRHGWSGSFYSGYGYGRGYGGYGYGAYYPSYYAPIVDRGYYYDYPRHYRANVGPYYRDDPYYRYDRPVVRRVVHRTVRYYDRDDRDHHRGRDGYRSDSYRNDRDYRRRDDSYGRGGGYYDRGN